MKANSLIKNVSTITPKLTVTLLTVLLLTSGILTTTHAADPVFGDLPNDLNVDENSPNTNVGSVIPVTDEDADDTLSYRLEDPDSAPFTTVAVTTGDTKGVQLKTKAGAAGTLDYESPSDTDATGTNTARDNMYVVTIIASDGTNDVEQQVTIEVNNKNEAPTFTDGASTRRSIAEDADPTGTPNVGGAVAATDPDGTTDINPEITGDETDLTYTLDAATLAEGVFAIGATDGQLTLASALDYETKGIYQITVTVSDGPADNSNTLTDTITVTITITDANDFPMFPDDDDDDTNTKLGTREIAENTAAGVNIGAAVEATDDDRDTLTYTLGGTDAALFAINSETGQLKTKAALNFEATGGDEHTVIVNVSDGEGGTDSITVTIEVENKNDAPIFTHGTSTSRSVAEGTAAGEDITEAVVTGGESNAVGATDPDIAGDNTDDTNPETDTVDDSLTYELGGTDAASFGIVATSGMLKTKAALDYETKSSYSVTVTVYDGPSSDTTRLMDRIAVTIRVTNANDAPVFPSETATRSVQEEVEADVNIGAPLSATDQDTGDTLTYSITSGAGTDFDIDTTNGQLKTATGVDLNYDGDTATRSYELVVTVTDDADTPATDTITVTINVTNVNEAPTADSLTATRTIPENTPSGRNIGNPVTATDPDGDTLTYTLGGTDAASFAIESLTTGGQLKTNAALDYEAKSDYEVTVTATDPNSLSVTITVTITLTDVDADGGDTNDDETGAPRFNSPSTTRNLDEGAADRNVGDAVTATGGTGDLTYSLEGADAASFAIGSTDGQITNKVALDYETKSSYTVTVKVADSASPPLTDTIKVTITVGDGDEAPVWTEGSSTTRTVAENTVAGVNIGAPISATDPEGATLAYSHGDRTNFDIDPKTGQLKTKAPLDYETTPSYTVTVTAGTGFQSALSRVTITVTDVNDAPVFATADIPTDLSVAENTVAGEDIGTAFEATDQDGDDLTYSVSGSDFDIDSESGQLKTKAPLDFEGKRAYEIMVTADDGNGGTATATATVSVTGVDDVETNTAPQFSDGASTTRSIAENTDAGDDITLEGSQSGESGAVTATDDTGQTVTYSLGGTDAASFDIVKSGTDAGQLKTKAALDHETKSSYTVIVTATDDHETNPRSNTITVTITVTDVNEKPMFASETATFTVAENTAAGVLVGTVPMATDPDEGDTLTYDVANAMGFEFDAMTRQLKTMAALNHEFKDQYKVAVTVTDSKDDDGAAEDPGVADNTIMVTINVTDVNEAPVFASDSMAHTVVEGTAADTDIGTPVKATDPDDGDTLTYTLGGVDMSSFAIESSATDGGQLQTKAALDYETKTDYEVTITATDRDGLTDEMTVIINIRNNQSDDGSVTNRPPVFSLGRSKTYEVLENTAAGHNLGTIRATDPESTQLTFTLGGPDSASFEFDSTLELLKTAVALDYEAKASHTATITVSDGSLSDELRIVLKVLNVNEAPTFNSGLDTTHDVDENTAAGMNIGGTYPATDPDGDNLTYSIGGPDGGFFAIDEKTGQLKTKAMLDHEAAASRMVTVMVEDTGSLTAELSVEITINDVNEAPMFPEDAPTALAVAENTAANTDLTTDSTTVAMYVAKDPDDGATLKYTLGGPDGASFASEALTDGGIKLKTKAALDYEAKRAYEVKITVSDGSLTDSVTVVISVTDDATETDETTLNNAPWFVYFDSFDTSRATPIALTSATRSVDENTAAGQNIGAVVEARDPDGNALTYTLGGPDALSFAFEGVITPSVGVQLKTKAALDYEATPTKTTYMVTITASDNALTDEITVTINLMDVNEIPVFSDGTSTTRSTQENVGKGASIGSAVSATDPDGGNLNYSLEGADASAFDIDVETGQLKTKAALDRETKATYMVTVVASDGALEARITVTITIGNENDAPMYDVPQVTRSVAENTATNTEFDTAVTARDPDGDTLTYSVSGTDFGINTETGVLKTRAALDYETTRDYEVTVTATDPSGLSDTIRVVIMVTNDASDDAAVVNSAPYFTAPRIEFEIMENVGPDTPIGTKITATDPDTGDVLTYALGGTDAASFNHEADGTGLQLKVKEGVLDYETKTDYEVTVTVRDSKNAAGTPDTAVDDSVIVTITVTNDPDDDDPESNLKPYFTSTSTTRTVDAGTGVRDILPEVIATDPEEDTLTYSITGGTGASRFTIVSTTGKLRTAVALTGGETHEVIVGVTDNKGPTGDTDTTIDDTITVTISVSGVNTEQNDPPTFASGSSVSYSIQQGAAGRTIGTPTANDPDGDPLTYAITAGNAGGLFAIDSATGRLSTALAVTTGTHTLTVTVSDRKDIDGNADTVVDARITVTITVTAEAQPPPGTGQPPAPQPLPDGTPGTPGTVPPVTNDPPTFDDGTSATRSVAENTPAGTNIGAPVGATDPNNDPLTYTLGGADAASFSIDGTSGQLMTSAALDFEVKRVYTVTVTANDGLTGGTASITVTINVTDVSVADGDPVPTNNAPVFASETATRSVAENTAAGGNIGAPVAATDTDAGEVLTYTLGGTDMASFDINGATGQLMVKATLDHETKASYTVMVTATDKGGLTDSITVTVTVTDVNEAPAFADATAARSVDENTAAGMAIGDAFMATDPDDGDTLTYSLGGTDAASFGIGGTTGQLMTMGMLDHETKASHTVMVIATDNGGLTGSITVTISVMDVNDAPMFASATATRMVEENTAAGMAIGDPVMAMDDDGDDITYSLGGTDMASFAIDTATGQLKTMADLDYEAKASHTVMVTASDGTLTSSVTVTIMVTDVPEFMLSVPAGQSLIHVPLKMMGLAKISDLYDKLGGATNVNLLITYDASSQRWISYLGDQNRGRASDRDLTDDLGILADMKNAVTLQLSGDALGTNGTASIALAVGSNLVGVPLKDSRITNVSDLLALDDNISFIIVSDGGEYKTITRAGDPGDVAVTGGQAFILNATAATTVTITGTGWASSAASSAPSWISHIGVQKDGVTAALAVTGSIVDEVKGLTAFHITVKNLSTGKVDTVATDADGYQLTFVDIETGRAAQVGDLLEITARAADPLVGVEPLRYVVTVDDVNRGHIQLDTLITYEVPAKTELLRNYPNPFNPETWIPYRLAKAANVTLTIYNQNGGVVRDIHLGHQIAAVYETRHKAIYWDGRNNLGERVASGIYFYHLTAGNYTATRKMVIVK